MPTTLFSSTAAPAYSLSTPAAVDGSERAASRRLRKREQDRQCQRKARERTKHRIEYLEGLVGDLQRHDESGQVADLLQQLSETRKERDSLFNTLGTIEVALNKGKGSLSATTMQTVQLEALGLVNASRHGVLSDHGEYGNLHSGRNQSNSMNDFEPSPLPLDDVESLVTNSTPLPDVQNNSGPENDVEFIFDPLLDEQLKDQTMSFLPDMGFRDPIVPPTPACECALPTPLTPPGTQINLWRFANEVLTEPVRLSVTENRAEDFLAEDIAVRSVVDGWAAAERAVGGRLPPSWRKLRKIDEIVFAACPKAERLAVLVTMHGLLRYHTDATPKRRSKLPPWLLARPSQAIAHSYAIDYFAWPGLRERFVFSQHRYCTNVFWSLFTSSLRLLWPYEFRDCYTRNAQTERYNVSYTFDDRIKDINAWTMSNGLFNRWPELYSDIPSFNQIPGSISGGNAYHAEASMPANATIASGGSGGAVRAVQAIMPLSPSQQGERQKREGEAEVQLEGVFTIADIDHWTAQLGDSHIPEMDFGMGSGMSFAGMFGFDDI